jgi:phenylacetate-coenzyme A ligase PaaK-like adenylate-forming protein
MSSSRQEGPGLEVPGLYRLLREIRRAGKEGPPAAASRRKERLRRLVGYARDRSPFYRQLYAALPADIPDLRTLPPVSKRSLSANFDAWATDTAVTRETAEAFTADPSRIGQLYLGRYVAFSTSGTTGSPAVLLQDMGAMSVYLALLLARRLPTLISPGVFGPFAGNRGRTATIVATGGHFASSVVDALARSAYPRLYRRNRTFSLMEPIPGLVDALNGFRPAVLGSYPTALAVLAEEQAAGRLRIAPAIVLSGAERLSAPLAKRIAASFRCPVRDTYAASEFMGIAFDCRHGRLHVNADWVILEPVDAGGAPVPPGQPSHTVLLTNLANLVQPLIRYDLGDSVTMLPGECPCGSRLPGIRPEGRRDETLHLEAPGGGSRPLLPLVLATVVEEARGVMTYQVLQAGPRRLLVRIAEAPGHDRPEVCSEVLRRLAGYLASQGLASMSVDLSEERPHSETAGGKLRQFFVARDGS